MKISNIFLKTLDPLIMNGFKNKKELDDYFFYSQMGCSILALGVLCFMVQDVFFDKNFSLNLVTLMVSIGYILTFTLIFLMPLIGQFIFIKMMPKNLTYWYVKYMWVNSKAGLLVLLSQLPQNIVSSEDMEKLRKDQDDNENIKILIKIWYKSFIEELHKKDTHGA